jgi:(5-formylfuran-3-yl)methyl phosphate synthase
VRLLVSVRSAAEAVAALDGAAHIVDAKEPARGPLGAVEPAVLSAILAQVPASLPVSVALGDFTTAKEVYASVAALPRRSGPMFVKIGFAGARSARAVSDLVVTAREAASGAYESPQVIAVAYADADQVDAPDPWDLCEAARRGGAAGVLLDTACKQGGTLVDLMPPGELSDWVSLAHLHELTAGIAGSLRIGDFEVVGDTGADIVGVRGAACDGGRTGTVSAERVAALVAAIQQSDLDLTGEMPEPPFGPIPG